MQGLKTEGETKNHGLRPRGFNSRALPSSRPPSLPPSLQLQHLLRQGKTLHAPHAAPQRAALPVWAFPPRTLPRLDGEKGAREGGREGGRCNQRRSVPFQACIFPAIFPFPL